ncbi:hypothetical protein [Salinibacterium sp.]|uniref:hypothetical protein n=1 Tax=Salinibacterium sp. TaxID=1915057 RepID=UPI00286AF16D|nr:hypothetical protein [Salinibacterium sp.]
MSDEARFDPRFDPAFQPGFEGLLESQAPVQPAMAQNLTVPPAVRSPPVTLDAAIARDLVEETPAGINPFIVVLGVVALVLLGGGLFLASRLQEMFAVSQGGSTFDYVTAQLVIYSAPLMMTLGAATAIGVLFLYAVRRGRGS